MTEKKILDGIKVLSLEQVHVLPWGTAFLADFGAEVLRVESVDHFQDRKNGPYPDDKVGDEWWNEGGTFTYWNRNKESLCLEVTHPKGKEIFYRLVEKCDIVTDNFRPGTMKRLGFDHETLVQVNPKIISLSCTAYGHTGAWRAAGSRARTVDASSGLSFLTGYEGGPSIRASSNYMDHTGGNNVAYALMLALYNRKKTGQGMRVDLSMQEAGVQSIGPALLEEQVGLSGPRLGCSHLWKAPHNVYPSKGEDRWITITVSDDEEWNNLKQAIGNSNWTEDPKFKSSTTRYENRQELDSLISNWTASWDNYELMHHLQSYNVTSGAVLTAADLVADPHLEDRGYFDTFDNPLQPQVGPRKFAGRPFRIPRIPTPLFQSPNLGQHNIRALREIGGLSDEEIDELTKEGIINSRPRDTEEKPQGGGRWGG